MLATGICSLSVKNDERWVLEAGARGVYSPGLCFARPPSLLRKEGQRTFYFSHPLCEAARVDKRSVPGSYRDGVS